MPFGKELKPNIIYTHHFGDLNIDHRITHQAVITACRPINKLSVREIYLFEVPSSTDWNSSTINNVFIPNKFVDIDKCFNDKVRALKAYKKELRNYPHQRSIEYIEILAKYRGTVVGLKKAEAFIIERIVS